MTEAAGGKKRVITEAEINAVVDKMTGGKSGEQVHAKLAAGEWPFTLSADEMHAASWGFILQMNARREEAKNGVSTSDSGSQTPQG